ncbi:unnamed protein product [Prunus armeniaca]
MKLNLDLLEGEREIAIVRVASYLQQLKSYHDKMAKVRQFQLGDLVLKKNFIIVSRQGLKKLNRNWEGPYVISWSGIEEAIHLTPLMKRKFHDNGMLTTFKDITYDDSSYLLNFKQMTEPSTFLKKRSNCWKFQLPIKSVQKETQGDDTRSVLREMQGALGIS